MKQSHELETAIRAAKEAGKIQLKNFGKPLEKTMKGSIDFATHVDYECENAILKILQKEFPEYGILSEEKGKIQPDADCRWIIDPLDGTLPYSFGITNFGVLIALEKKGDLELGVVHIPVAGKLLVAQRNKGAFLNGQRIHVSEQKKLAEARLAFGNIQTFLKKNQNGFCRLLDSVQWRNALPGLIALPYLCTGNIDVFLGGYQKYGDTPPQRMKPWDIAAFKILVEESGGTYSDSRGKKNLDNISCVVATNGALHQTVLQALQTAEANP